MRALTPFLLRRRATTDPAELIIDTEDGGVPVDADGQEPETGPLRRCVVTRERLPKERMFRFVVSPDRVLVPDLQGKLPGRGIWLSASRDVIEGPHGASSDRTSSRVSSSNASSSGAKGRELIRAIARAARGPVRVPSDLPVVLEAALIRRVGDFMGLARRAGQAIAGFEKARDWMRTHPTGLVMQAADGSEAERARFRSAVPAGVPVLTPLTGADLGRVFGHETVVHVAVAPGRLADTLIADTGRLAGLRGAPIWAPDPPPLVARDKTPERAPEEVPDAALINGMTPHGAAGRATAETNDVTGTNG